MLLFNHNPDVLDCIANLSNDEVFTPPEIANAMLDQVATAWANDHAGANIWADPNVKFLDPFTKSGVFLREITQRLTDGLATKIPDRQERVNHVLTQQVYGIAITRLTAMLARRSVYCSKWANREHSICTAFDDDAGNIWFERAEHTWGGGKPVRRARPTTGDEITVYTNRRCTYCGANEADYNRGDERETHAYTLIHTDSPHLLTKNIFGETMQFDVVIGNPPYQLSDGGGSGTSAAPIYQLFVEQAKKLDPSYLTMIIPSRWFTGGKGLDSFRDKFLRDTRLRQITDYLNASDVFSGIGLKGGVCYFLWNRDNRGECEVTTHFKDHYTSTAVRPLLEDGADVFIRFNEALPIIKKVLKTETGGEVFNFDESSCFESLVSPRRPFGLPSTYKGHHRKKAGQYILHQKGEVGYVATNEITAGHELIDSWKIFVGFAAPGTGNKDTYPHRVISTPFLGKPGEVSTETYLAIGPFNSKSEAQSALSYMSCRLTRFLVQLRKSSQNTTRKVYGFVPMQTWDRQWTDDLLYKKYGITADEIAFIESIVRPLEVDLDGSR